MGNPGPIAHADPVTFYLHIGTIKEGARLRIRVRPDGAWYWLTCGCWVAYHLSLAAGLLIFKRFAREN